MWSYCVSRSQVSSGTTLQAQKLIEKMLKMCNSELSPETKASRVPIDNRVGEGLETAWADYKRIL